MPAVVLVIFLPRNAALGAMSLRVPCHWLSCLLTVWVLGNEPQAACGGLRAASAQELMRSNCAFHRDAPSSLRGPTISDALPGKDACNIYPVRQEGVAASPLKKEGLLFI